MTGFASSDEFRKALDRLNEAAQKLLDVTLARERKTRSAGPIAGETKFGPEGQERARQEMNHFCERSFLCAEPRDEQKPAP
jgi:hypothetical protein